MTMLEHGVKPADADEAVDVDSAADAAPVPFSANNSSLLKHSPCQEFLVVSAVCLPLAVARWPIFGPSAIQTCRN
eukprot:6189046-Pleurochrysis_carterae.AAC.4